MQKFVSMWKNFQFQLYKIENYEIRNNLLLNCRELRKCAKRENFTKAILSLIM